MSQITFETLLAAINTTPSEYEEKYVRWVSIGYDKKGSHYKRNYYTLLDLEKHPISDWRDMIKEFQYIISLF